MSATTAPTTAPTPAHGRSKAVNIILWVLQVFWGLFFIGASAAPKLLGLEAAAQSFEDMGAAPWFMYFTGLVELAGGIGLMIPVLSGLASAGLVGVMIGAVYVQAVALEAPSMAIFPAALGVMFVVMSWGRAPQTRRLFGLLRR